MVVKMKNYLYAKGRFLTQKPNQLITPPYVNEFYACEIIEERSHNEQEYLTFLYWSKSFAKYEQTTCLSHIVNYAYRDVEHFPNSIVHYGGDVPLTSRPYTKYRSIDAKWL